MRFLLLSVLTLLLTIIPQASANSDLSQRARIACNEAKFDEAKAAYEEIIKLGPQDIEAYLNLAYLYKDLSEYEQAIEIIRSAAKTIRDSRLIKLLGQLYYLKGNPKKAILLLEQLLSSHSGDYEVLLYLGFCYQDIGRVNEAQRFYLDVIKINPKDVLAYLKLANIYYQQHKLQEAAETYQEIIHLDPSITDVRSRLAECFRDLGKFTKAYKQYAKCLAIDPEDDFLQRRLTEIKTKLSEDFLKKKKESALQRRKIKSMQVKASPYSETAALVRIGIAKIKGTIEFKCGSPFTFITKDSDNLLFEGSKESVYSLVFNGKNGIQLKDSEGNILRKNLHNPFIIKNTSCDSVITMFDLPYGKGSFWAGWHDQQYRGIVEVVSGYDGFQLINIINLEEYLYSVLPSEMPANWPTQALCAQAIAARTWAMRNKNRHKEQGYNFCSSVHCQVYKGARVETPFTNKAVDKTAGIILAVKEDPIDIFYSTNCGGYTQDGVADTSVLNYIFPLSPLELNEWLRQDPDTFCNLKQGRLANFRWVRLYTKEKLEAVLNRHGVKIQGILKIIPQGRSRSGHLTSVKIVTEDDTEVINGENKIRKLLGGLRSSAFNVETKFNQTNIPIEFVFYGAGFGHGRGMCQSGAKGMALTGYGYLEILKHYFPNVEIKKIY